MAWRLGSFEGHTVALYKLNLFIALYQGVQLYTVTYLGLQETQLPTLGYFRKNDPE